MFTYLLTDGRKLVHCWSVWTKWRSSKRHVKLHLFIAITRASSF